MKLWIKLPKDCNHRDSKAIIKCLLYAMLTRGFISMYLPMDWLIYCVYCHFQQYFSYIMATSFSGGRSRSIRREPRTMGKQLVNVITCGCESSAPLFAYGKFEDSTMVMRRTDNPTNNAWQTTTQQNKDWTIRTTLKRMTDLRCPERVSMNIQLD